MKYNHPSFNSIQELVSYVEKEAQGRASEFLKGNRNEIRRTRI